MNSTRAFFVLPVVFALAACGAGGSTGTLVPAQTHAAFHAHHHIAVPRLSKERRPLDASGALVDGGFESGGYTSWQQCGSNNASVTTARAHSGSYSELAGSETSGEVTGSSGLCQQITVPSGGQITFWVYQGATETNTAVSDQEGDLLDAYGNTVYNFYTTLNTSTGWTQMTADLSAYAGQTLWLYFGIYGSGSTTDTLYQYVDDVAWTSSATPTPGPSATPPPSGPQYFEVVMMENQTYSNIIGNTAQAPYINNTLVPQAAVMTQSYGVTHPSQPNYLAIFSGDTQGVIDDSCGYMFSTENLAHELTVAGKTFGGYAEDIPSASYTGCTSGLYAQKHVPWLDFTNAGTSYTRVYTGFPSNPENVTFIIPNLCDDMHNSNCGISSGDTWLSNNMPAIMNFNNANNGVLIITWDEDDSSGSNQIATLLIGPSVIPGQYAQQINHYNVLRTVQDHEGVPCIANSCTATAISGIWK